MRLALALCLWAGLASAALSETLRIATFNASLSRSGPGVLLGDLLKGGDPQIEAVAQVIRTVRPDILLINEFDFDADAEALTRFRDLLARPGAGKPGHHMPHFFNAPSNTGIPTGLDLNGDALLSGPRDAFGYGRFPGQYGMAILSRFAVMAQQSHTFGKLRWSDFADNLLPVAQDGAPYASEAVRAALRLSSKSHWDVAVDVPGGPLRLLASHPTPPVFDGSEDVNGRRNHDEIMFWVRYLDGAAFMDDAGMMRSLDTEKFVVLGDLNADPSDGDGIRAGIRTLLAHPKKNDPMPASSGASAAARMQGGANDGHAGKARHDTADWRDIPGPGNLRVDFVLPSAHLTVLGSGVFWPAPGEPDYDLIGDLTGPAARVGSDHRLVWVDVSLP